MKTSAIWAAAALVAATIGIQGSGLADEKGAAAGPRHILGTLNGTAVSAADLNGQHARGSPNINISTTTITNNDKTINSDGSFNDGTLRGNAVIGPSVTGIITTSNSINNNAGITNVIQNSGNNSLFQQSTSIFITVH
jgi:hypothetical protein